MSTTTTKTGNASEKTNPWDKKEFGAFWKRKKQANGETYVFGTINLKNIEGFPDKDVAFVGFSNKAKNKDSHPDFRLYVSEKQQSSSGTKTEGAAKPVQKTPPPTVPDASELI